jgi:drug/metabolite transporter (DMT)-like permease
MSNFSALISVRRHHKIEYVLIIAAIAGIVIMIGGYLISQFLVERDRVILESLSPDDPNWLFYRDLGDAAVVYFYSLIAGGVLVILSLIGAVVYYSMRHGFTYKLKGSLDRLKLKGSSVE